MKTLLLCALLLCFAGCGSINEMNSNMSKTNELMDENIVVTKGAQVTIQENTRTVSHSTDSMTEFEGIIADNTAAVERVMNEIHANSHALSLGVLSLLALLFLPSLILLIFFFKFLKTLRKGQQ
jgi:hypothetical protein